MRIKTTSTRNGRLFYVIKTYYDAKGKEHSITVEKLGNENAIREKYNCDPDVWAKEYVKKLNEQEKLDNADVQISFSPSSRISRNHQYEFNIGYLFLQSLYHQLGIDKICNAISKEYRFDYDLNNILSRLIYGRIIHPCSKIATLRFARTLLEQPVFSEQHIYRALDVLAEKFDFIQEKLYTNSFALGKRKSGVIYYDCTNFFFEIEEADEDGLRQYGKSKENRPLPIVEMGMFIDSDGIPLSICINPGNTNEQVTLKPLEQKIISDFHMSKFIVCTDAGLASKANRKFNDLQDRAFIVTQSIKKLKADLKEWALDTEGWRIYGQRSKKKYSIADLDPDIYYDTIFYKEQWIDQGSFEEKLIVTYSLKYCMYQRNIRNNQIDRAQRAISQGSARVRKKRQNDFMRFIERISITDEGETADKDKYYLNHDRIAEEERYDGYYAVVSNIDDNACDIIKINRQRWKIEECFRIMKTDFKSRPAYTRTDVTDALHDAFGFRTDSEIITQPMMKKILKEAKPKIRHAKI